MRIAFIHPPFHHRKFSENLKVVDEEFTLSPPIILAYVSAIAKQAGHNCILVDAHALKLSKDETLFAIKRFAPDLLAFRVDTYSFQETLEWIRYLKAKTGKTVLVGGINMDIYPFETMSHMEIDYGLSGEVIETLPEFLKYLENSDLGKLKNIKGLCYRDEKGNTVCNPKNKALLPFDLYPFPSRELLPNHIYHSFVSQVKNFTIMLTSTGCPYKCRFCAIAALRHWRQRSVENVMKEIEECYYNYRVREIDFFDATFFVDRDWSMRFCEEIIKRKLNIVWTCRSRVNLAREEILRLAAKAGCRMIFWGIESSSPKVISEVDKEITTMQVEYAIKTAKKYGISNLGFLMVGNSGDNKKTIKDTIRFAKKLDLDYVQICRAIAKPNTGYHKDLIEKTGFDYWRHFVLGNIGEERIQTPWLDMSQQEIEKLLKWSYYSFYLRPSYIIKRICKIKSFEEFIRYFKVGLRMLSHYFYTDTVINNNLVKRLAHISIGDNCRIEDYGNVYVIIPSYNERDNIIKLIQDIFLLYNGINIVVVDSSNDGSLDVLKKFSYNNLSLIYMPKMYNGNERGRAMKLGFDIALSRGAKYIVEMDADLSHNPADISSLLDYVKSNSADIAIGSRYITSTGEFKRSILRRILGYCSNLYIRYSLGLSDIHDTTSGYRAYSAEALYNLKLSHLKSIEGTELLIEMLYLGFKKGFTIKEVPITYYERHYGKSKFSFFTIKRSLKRVWELGILSRGKV